MPTEETVIETEQKIIKKSSAILEILKLTLLALIIVVPTRYFIAQPFVVQGYSMTPTFNPSDYLIIDEITPRFHAPERGDIMIFRYPLDTDTYFIKRVVGLPGETISIASTTVMVTKEGESHTFTETYRSSPNNPGDEKVITLASDEYYMLGDNRRASSDSRMWGPLKEKYFVGRAFVRILPLSSAGYLPGKKEMNPQK